MSYADRFGGNAVNPADVAYKKYTLSADLVTQWPAFANANNVCARTLDITALVGDVDIRLPDAREASNGETVLVYNSGAQPFQIQGNNGLAIATLQPGDRRLLELADNTTQDGSWLVTLLGVGTASLDVAGAAGAGLKAIGTTLNLAYVVETVAANRAVSAADRAKVLVWTGGAGTLTLPATTGLEDFAFEVRNQGTGALTLQGTGGELIDGSATAVFNNTESAWVHADAGAWYSVGRGRNAQFNFTQLVKTVTGGIVTETLTEAANVVQTINGVLTSNLELVLPAVVQVYYISNQTSGAFNFLIRNPGGSGSTVSLPSGQNAVIFSDGTNVINASTTIAGINQVTFGNGSAANPSVAIGASNTGFYSPGAGQVAFSSSGTQTFLLNNAGAQVVMATNAALGVTSSGGTAAVNINRPAGAEGYIQFQTAGSPRWTSGADGTTESGSNAGSNWAVKRFSDAGTLIDTPIEISRATGQVTIRNGVKDTQSIGRIEWFIWQGGAKTGYLPLEGSLVSRTTYADLWAYAQTTTPVSEAAWSGGQSGRFSVGDGATTFRLPDLRGVSIRGWDNGRGLDAGRAWGTYQADQMIAHSHVVNDGGHNHAHSDPGHSHTGGTDAQGYHAHGVSDPGHAHGRGEFNGINLIGGSSGAYVRLNNGTPSVGTDGAGTGIGIFADGLHAHNVSVSGSFTGMANVAAATGISLQNAGAGTETRGKNVAYPAYVRY